MLGCPSPRNRHPPPLRPENSPWSRHPPPPPGADTPPSRAVHAGRYGQQAGGMHPTGMQSCLFVFSNWLKQCPIIFKSDIIFIEQCKF